MASIDLIRASNGSGDAVKATVTNARVISSTTLQVSAVTNFPSKFIATVGSVDGTGAFVPATVTVFNGHTSSGNIEIDSFAPGYTDLGNTPGQIVVLKPTTAWADEVAGVLDVTHNDNGTIKNNAVKTAMLDAANIDASVALKDASVTSSKIDFTTLSGTTTQWRTWTPTLSNHSGTVNVARYTLVGKTCQFYLKVTLTSGASAALNITLPVTASSSLQTGSFASALPTIIGYGGMIKNGIGYFQVFPYLYSTTQANLGVVISNGGAGTYLGYQDSGPSKPATWANNDQYIISGAYETA